MVEAVAMPPTAKLREVVAIATRANPSHPERDLCISFGIFDSLPDYSRINFILDGPYHKDHQYSKEGARLPGHPRRTGLKAGPRDENCFSPRRRASNAMPARR